MIDVAVNQAFGRALFWLTLVIAARAAVSDESHRPALG